MVTEGNMHIALTQGASAKVQITSSRPLTISQYFSGKTTAEVMLLLGQMYQLCGVAHQYAFVQALARAGLQDVGDREAQYYTMLLTAETIKEHCVTMFTRWAFQPGGNDVKAMQTILASYQKLLAIVLANTQAFTVARHVDTAALDTTLTVFCQAVYQLMLGDTRRAHMLETSDDFEQWLGHSQGVAGVFLHHLELKGWQHLGAVPPQHLPNLSAAIGASMQDEAFIAQPQYEEKCYETTPLSRQQDHVLVQAVAAQHGHGVFTRAVAKVIVVTLIKALQQGREFVEMICYDSTMDAKGFVQVEAARGRLLHQVQLDKNLVCSYQILAPTEWNFHPQGVVAQMLASLPVNNKTIVQEQVALLVNAVDPCVGYTLEVCDA